MNSKLFLDLEETIIDSWASGLLINTDIIKSWVGRTRQDCEVHIFSFAIWNDEDKSDFERRFKPVLERVLEVEIVSWPSVEEVMNAVSKHRNFRFESMTEFIAFEGKVGALTDFAFASGWEACLVTLIDDVVPNRMVRDMDRNLTLDFVNVNSLKDSWFNQGERNE